MVELVDASGNLIATYSYDAWGNLTSSSESFPGGANGWTNPYRYDGRDGARYDASDGLYWLSVRAYDPSLGRFLSRDPLGRAPLFVGGGNPYVYAGNNPLSNVDPSGQRAMGASASQTRHAATRNSHRMRVRTTRGGPTPQQIARARKDAHRAANEFDGLGVWGAGVAAVLTSVSLVTGIVSAVCAASAVEDGPTGVNCAIQWYRAFLASSSVGILATAFTAAAFIIAHMFDSISDSTITNDAWFATSTSFDTFAWQVTAVAVVAGILSSLIVAVLAAAGPDGFVLLPVGLMGGIGIAVSLGGRIHYWLQVMRHDLGDLK